MPHKRTSIWSPSTIGQPPTQKKEVLRRGFRIFLANFAIALGWALKNCCEAGAYRLVATARWLVPEAERFLVLRTGSHNHQRRIFEFAVDLDSRMQSFKLAAGGLIVLILLGSLVVVTRPTAITTPSTVLEPSREFSPVSGMQSEVIPLPTRKPQTAYSVSDDTGRIPVTQKRVAHLKSARHKSKR
jgi:hypothetical protein